MKRLLFVSIVFFTLLFVVSCKKKDTKICFSQELAGEYVGDLTETSPATVTNSGRVRVSVNGCESMTIQITAPISKTYTLSSITTGRTNSYTAKTNNGNEATVSFTNGRIEITVDPTLTFSGQKQ